MISVNILAPINNQRRRSVIPGPIPHTFGQAKIGRLLASILKNYWNQFDLTPRTWRSYDPRTHAFTLPLRLKLNQAQLDCIMQIKYELCNFANMANINFTHIDELINLKRSRNLKKFHRFSQKSS